MMTATDELIDDYLERLDTAARGLPASRRVELLAEIKEHITVALAEGPDRGEAEVRTILDRLGDPEEIVRAAGGPPAGAAGPTADGGEHLAGTRVLAALAIAVVLTLANSVFPFPLVGWALGAVLAWALTRWPTRHKLLAVVIWPLGFGLGGWFLYLLGPGATGSSLCGPNGHCVVQDNSLMPVPAQMTLGLIGVLAGVIGTILVVRRDRRAQWRSGRIYMATPAAMFRTSS